MKINEKTGKEAVKNVGGPWLFFSKGFFSKKKNRILVICCDRKDVFCEGHILLIDEENAKKWRMKFYNKYNGRKSSSFVMSSMPWETMKKVIPESDEGYAPVVSEDWDQNRAPYVVVKITFENGVSWSVDAEAYKWLAKKGYEMYGGNKETNGKVKLYKNGNFAGVFMTLRT